MKNISETVLGGCGSHGSLFEGILRADRGPAFAREAARTALVRRKLQ